MGYWTLELDGRPLQVLEGSLSEVGRDAYGATIDFLKGVHGGDGAPLWDARKRYHPFIRPATPGEVRAFETRQAEMAAEMARLGIDDASETPSDLRCCRAHTLIQVFDMPEDDEVSF